MAYVPTKEQKAAYQKTWYEKNKARHVANVVARKTAIVQEVTVWIRDLKESTPCADCGLNYPYYVMNFDHLGDKEYLISKMISAGYNKAKIQSEIDKCELVCSNCHRIRTFTRT